VVAQVIIFVLESNASSRFPRLEDSLVPQVRARFWG